MKKSLLVIAVSLLLATFVSSCKVVEPCPAYGNGSIGAEQIDNSSL